MVRPTPALCLAAIGLLLLILGPAPTIGQPATMAKNDDVFGASRDFFPVGPLGLWVLPGNGSAGSLTVRKVERSSPVRPAPNEGDRLTAIGDVALSGDDARTQLATALVAAAASDDRAGRVVSLTFDRDGETYEAQATLRPAEPWAEEGAECERTAQLQRAALRYLDGRQRDDGSFPTDLAATNGTVVVSSMAGLAYLAAGDTTRDGDRTRAIRELVRWIDRNVGDDPIDQAMRRRQPDVNWNQTNWAHAIGAVYLAALDDRDSRSRGGRTVAGSVRALCEAQTERGGWGHGPGGVNAQGYIEFSAVTAWSCYALALGSRIGSEPEEGVLPAGLEYLREATSDGQLAYATGMRGGGGRYAGVGRTAIGWLAFHAAGSGDAEAEDDADRSAAMAGYVREHLDQLADAHQGYLLQLLQTALFCRAVGDEAWGEFWAYVRPEIDLAIQSDGRFVPRPTPETLRMRANNDIALGDAWATAIYATILGLHADAECLPLLTDAPADEDDGDDG